MSMDSQRLNVAVFKYLEGMRDSVELSEDTKESLEVAIQCLQEVFSIDPSSNVPCPDLKDVFAAYQQPRPISDEENRKKAEHLKAKGNVELKQGNLQSALDLYSKAIECDGSNAVFYCNRALVFIKLDDLASAHKDCARAIELNPTYPRAFGRLGYIFKAQSKWTEAKEAYTKALELDSSNDEYQGHLREIEAKIEEASKARPQMPPGLPGGMDFQQFFQNPQFMNAASQMMQSPMFRSMATNFVGQMGNSQSEEGSSQDGGDLMANLQSLAGNLQQPNRDSQGQGQGEQDGSGSKDSSQQ